MSKKPSKQSLQKKKPGITNNAIFGFLIALSVIFMIVCINHKFIQDDAFISFRYVQNFVDGHGLVFNIGERVEGYTNLLWVLILSLCVFLKINIESAAQTLSLIFGVLVLYLTYFLSGTIVVRDESRQTKKQIADISGSSLNVFNVIPVLLLVSTGSYVFWSISGMETTMFISFCLLGIFYYIKERDSEKVNFKFPLFILLATLTRPEGLYFFGLIMIHKIFFAFRENKFEGLKNLVSRSNLISYLIYGIPVILYFVIRYSYYGYLFPNTYYAKTGLSSAYISSGIDYFTKFLTSYLLYGFILLLPLYLFKKKDNIFEVSLFYLLIISFMLYVISVGGDVLKQNRFFLPVLPLIYILFAKFLNEMYFKIRSGSGQSVAAGAIAVVVCIICIYYYSSQKETLENEILSENGLVEKMKVTGNWFRTKQTELGRPLTLAATTIGSVSYFSGTNVNVIDLLGLTDEEIAHNPKIIPEISAGNIGWKERNYNADYVMSRDPDYIYFSTGVKPSAYAERALFTNEEFLKYYYPYYFTEKGSQFTEVVYKRKTDEQAKDITWEFPGNPNYKPSFVNMYNQAMNTSRDKSRNAVALSEFQQTLDIGPSHFDMPYQNMGDIYLQMGKKDKAMESFRMAIELNDFNILSHYQLYQLYSERGDSANAKASFDKVLLYDPEIMR